MKTQGNNKKVAIGIAVIIILLIIMYFGTSFTGAVVLSGGKKTSIERSASECTIWKECNVQLKIRVGNIEKLEIHEQVPMDWQIIRSNSNYSYDESKGEVVWMFALSGNKAKDSTITYSIIPNSKSGKFLGSWVSYPDGKKGKIEGKQKITAKASKAPLIININQPINNSNVSTKSVYVTAVTNRNAICQYDKILSILLNRALVDGLNLKPVNMEGEGIPILNQSNLTNKTLPLASEIMNITGGKFHSQLIENLQDGGRYTIKLSCIDALKNFQLASVEFWARTLMPVEYVDVNILGVRKSIGDSFSSRNIITSYGLPNLLSDGQLYLNETKSVMYSPSLLMGSSKIENSTSNGDLNFPRILIEAGINSSNYLYKYQLTFSNNINFSASAVHGRVIKMAGENYTIGNDSTNQRIVLIKGNSILILENNQPAKINGKVIDGTSVKFVTDSNGNIASIDIIFAMQDLKKDYIAVGESYDDPFFQNIRLAFESYSDVGGAKIYIGSIKG